MKASLLNDNFWAEKQVLVTGHTGFKGSWLSLWLSQLGARVTGISIEPDTSPNLCTQLDLIKRIENHHITDIRNVEKVAEIVKACRPDVVFHLAAQPLVRRSYQQPLSTWAINVQGCLNLLEALKISDNKCAVVMITTDKVYENKDWDFGYRECDRLGGIDPYSASKAAAELAISSWRESFCGKEGHQTEHLEIATARAGNVIGGGDWSEDRIIPDPIRALTTDRPICIRNPQATRPWQHVLEPLSGYMRLAEALLNESKKDISHNSLCEAFNFGPKIESNLSVLSLIEQILKHWPGTYIDLSSANEPHEAHRLHLQIDKAYHRLSWQPKWSFTTTVEKTVNWYKKANNGYDPYECCLEDIEDYTSQSNSQSE